MKNLLSFFLLICFVSCSIKDNPLSPPTGKRTFYLGFTPFPYDITTDAVNYTYDKIKTDGDIINHHFDDGIPWDDALLDQPFNQSIQDEWQTRKSKTPSTHKVIVSVTPLNPARSGLALYKNSNGNQPLPGPWSFYNFNHPNVRAAYLNYCKRIINFFNPDFFVVGIEVNLLAGADNTMNSWKAYLELHKYVYLELKKNFPNLPIMVSMTAMDLLSGYTSVANSLQLQVLNDITPYTDYFAVSLYPFLSKLLTDSLPDNLFDTIFSLSNKPICITETGYPAQTFSINNGSVVFNGTPQKQKDYFDKLFSAANNYKVVFIINFVVRDYDKLWQAIGSPDDINKVWRDTGIYDETGKVRTVYESWKNMLSINVGSQ